MIDYALTIEYLMGVAEYGTATTYKDLERTWRDIRQIPTDKELKSVWVDVYKNLKYTSVDQIRNNRKYATPIEYNGDMFNSDEESYRLVAEATSLYVEESIEDLPQPWWDVENTERLFTLTNLKGLRSTIAGRTQYVMTDARTVKANIKTASTIQEVDDIYDAYINE